MTERESPETELVDMLVVYLNTVNRQVEALLTSARRTAMGLEQLHDTLKTSEARMRMELDRLHRSLNAAGVGVEQKESGDGAG